MKDEPGEAYPVIIEVTTQHVVWIAAESAGQALDYAKSTPFYELIDDSKTAATYWDSVHAPDGYDWETVYPQWGSDGSYLGRNADAHVETHKHHLSTQKLAAERAACAEAGHPDTETPISDGRRWCKGCRTYLPAVETAEVA